MSGVLAQAGVIKPSQGKRENKTKNKQCQTNGKGRVILQKMVLKALSLDSGMDPPSASLHHT